MEAHLCSLCTSVVLYPEAHQTDDRYGRLLGYIELDCKTDCDVDTIRLRLMGKSKTKASALTYEEADKPAMQYASAFNHFLIKEATFFDVHTYKKLDLSGSKKFAKGKHM